MSIGADLLKLQEFDLSRARVEEELKGLPILRELAKKRSAHARLKNEALQLMAQRKDAQTDLDDLDREIQACESGVTEAQSRGFNPEVREEAIAFEEELATFAKRIDRARHLRPDAEKKLVAAQERERKLTEYLKRFEDGIVEDTKAAREQASALQSELDDISQRRGRIASRLPEDVVNAYEFASKRFGGLAVERLEGNVPSVCRTSLQTSSMDEIRHAQSYTTCPYCHRILVVEKVVD